MTTVVTTAMGLILAAAATGSWTMALEFRELQQKFESREDRLESHEAQIQNLRRRVRWLERQRNTHLSLWSER